MLKRDKLKVWLLITAFTALMSVPFLVPHTGPLALFAFTPLLALDRITHENGTRHSWLYFLAAFLLFNVCTTYWIWFVSEAGAVAAIILNSLQMTGVFCLFRLVRNIFEKRNPELSGSIPYIFLIAAWLAWEHIYFEIELSWPWLVLGNAFATTPGLVQWYSITGALGGTLWILLSGISLHLGIAGPESRRRIWHATARIIIPGPLIASVIIACFHPDPVETGRCEVVVVQPNVDPFSKYGVIPQAQLDRRMLELAEAEVTDSTSYVITPETVTYDINIDSPSGNKSMEAYSEFIARHPGTKLLLGALTYRTYNSALKPTHSARNTGGMWYDSFNTAMVTDGTEVESRYFKSKLVPGVEIIPYQNVLSFLGPLVESFGGSSSSYGTQDEMDVLTRADGGPKAGAMICYESVYGDYSRVATKKGAEFLAVMTNDGWWGDTPGYRQHFRFAALRAIENRRYVVHAANTGISGIIDPYGRVEHRTGWWEETAFRADIGLRSDITPFVRHGDVIGQMACWLFILIAVAVSVIAVSGKRSSRGKSA